MSPTLSRSFACLLVSCLFHTSTSSRRTGNHHQLHRHHHARQEFTTIIVTPPSLHVTSESMPTATGGDQVMSDIQEIQQGLVNLPSDLVKFIGAIEERFEALEAMIASLLGSSTEAAVSSITTPPNESLTDILRIPGTPIVPPTPGSPVTTSLCRPAAGAEPLVPCPGHRSTRHRSTRRITRTSFQTITLHAPYSFANRTSGSGGIATSQWVNPAPYPYSLSESLVVQTITPQSATPSTSTFSSYSSPPSQSAYTFDPDASNNVAV